MTAPIRYKPLPGIYDYLESTLIQAGSQRSVMATHSGLARFCVFIETEASHVTTEKDVTQGVVEHFQRHLFVSGYKRGYVQLCVMSVLRWLRWMRNEPLKRRPRTRLAPIVSTSIRENDVTRILCAIREQDITPAKAALLEICVAIPFCLQVPLTVFAELTIRDVDNGKRQALLDKEYVPYGPNLQRVIARWLMCGKRRRWSMFMGGRSRLQLSPPIQEAGNLVGLPLTGMDLRRLGMSCLKYGRDPDSSIPPDEGIPLRSLPASSPLPRQRRQLENPKSELVLSRLVRSDQYQVDF
jgi:hypothetical protein